MTQPTPESVARHGHVAALLRRYLDSTGMSVADFSHHILGNRNSTTPYLWLRALGSPGPLLRKTLHRKLGVPEAYFVARDPHLPTASYGPEPTELKVPTSWTERKAPAEPRQAVATVPATKLTGRPPNGTPRPPDGRREVLSFRLYDDHTASVRLVADELPAEQGKSLLRVLLEAGLSPAD